MEVSLRDKFEQMRHQRRIKQVKQGQSDELSNHDNNSIWSRVPPSPRACNEDLIWKSKLHRKNQFIRGVNSAVGRLGQYIVLDPENVHRLDDKIKQVIKNVTPVGRNANKKQSKTMIQD